MVYIALIAAKIHLAILKLLKKEKDDKPGFLAYRLCPNFLEKLNKIDPSVLSKISEISYKPNEYDKDLFLFLMNDGNYVYITTTKLSNIDKYENVLIQLEGKKGIIYLDSGNHFEIFQ